ncbi:hypothetical protein IC582_007536 [Cucumis melo]
MTLSLFIFAVAFVLKGMATKRAVDKKLVLLIVRKGHDGGKISLAYPNVLDPVSTCYGNTKNFGTHRLVFIGVLACEEKKLLLKNKT